EEAGLADHVVGVRYGHFAARKGNFRARLPAAHILDLLATEIDHEADGAWRPVLAGNAADAGICCDHPAEIGREGLIGIPEHAVGEIQRAAGFDRAVRHPVHDDVVVDLDIGRNLDELDLSLAPVSPRLDPDGGPAVIEDTIVLVMIE